MKGSLEIAGAVANFAGGIALLIDALRMRGNIIFRLPAIHARVVSKRVALRLNPRAHRGAPALLGEALCYAFRLDEFSAAPPEAPCQSRSTN
jgi:hypothetical protein